MSAASVAVNVPSWAARARFIGRAPLRIDRHHDALRAVFVRGGINDVGIRNRRGVETGLVGARVEQPADVFHRAHAAANSQGNEHLRSNGFDHVQDQVALVAGGGDVQERKFIGALLVVARGDLHRVTGIAQVQEVHALDDAAACHVQARNDPFGEHSER
jgi:hypothetical protein